VPLDGEKVDGVMYFDVAQAAVFMRCCTMQIYRDCKKGLMPHIRRGKRLIFKRDDLVGWLDTQRIGPVFSSGIDEGVKSGGTPNEG